MHDLSFTRRGWVDEQGRMPYATYASDGNGHLSYGIELRAVPEVTSCFHTSEGYPPASEPDHIEAVLLLYNIALGHRQTTPLAQNAFIDRHSKTFFSGTARVGYTLTQEHVTNISAFANYVNMMRREEGCGVCERLFDEYCFIVGNLAYTLFHAIEEYRKRRGKGGRTRSAAKDGAGAESAKRKPTRWALHESAVSGSFMTGLCNLVRTLEDAVVISEGTMIACCVHDHTAIEKDRSSTKMRRALARYDKALEGMRSAVAEVEDAGNMRICLFKAISAFPDMSEGSIQVIIDGTDDIVDWISWDKSGLEWHERYATPDGRGRAGRKGGSGNDPGAGRGGRRAGRRGCGAAGRGRAKAAKGETKSKGSGASADPGSKGRRA